MKVFFFSIPSVFSLLFHRFNYGDINLFFQATAGNPYAAPGPVMMVSSTHMYGTTPYVPVSMYTTPPVVAAAPAIDPSLRASAEIELKQVILHLLDRYFINFDQIL